MGESEPGVHGLSVITMLETPKYSANEKKKEINALKLAEKLTSPNPYTWTLTPNPNPTVTLIKALTPMLTPT